MLKEETYTKIEKKEIADKIQHITMDEVNEEMDRLIEIGQNSDKLPPRAIIGNSVVDYFTFIQRLETKGKYNINYFEFLANLSTFKKKKFIQTIFEYYKNNRPGKNKYVIAKYVYNVGISAINIMKPINCMEIYTKYNATRVLNPCAGWGGSAVGAAALNIEAFYGIEINKDLEKPYERMVSYLKKKSDTKIKIWIKDSAKFDYSKLVYDVVFTSPPYYFIEKYANNKGYASKDEMDQLFYRPMFLNTFKHLKRGGRYIINVSKEVYTRVLLELFGHANEVFPLKKSTRQNEYQELVYVWFKK